MSCNPHICVCVCTYKRSNRIAPLLKKIQEQETNGRFSISICVVDNDHEQTGKAPVIKVSDQISIPVMYYVEETQNIALARNKAIENAKGDFIAFIDDDELPEHTWLLTMLQTLQRSKADGVLGPVKPFFEVKPPSWIIKGKFFDRPSHPSGYILNWTQTRTGNTLIKSNVFADDTNRFRAEFGSGGEDRNFFKRMIEKGYTFIWCKEAPIYEIIPPERLSRMFMIRRALLRGKISLIQSGSGIVQIATSLIAIFLYSLALPFLFVYSHHTFMKYLIKDCDHLGKILALCGIDLVKENYVVH